MLTASLALPPPRTRPPDAVAVAAAVAAVVSAAAPEPVLQPRPSVTWRGALLGFWVVGRLNESGPPADAGGPKDR